MFNLLCTIAVISTTWVVFFKLILEQQRDSIIDVALTMEPYTNSVFDLGIWIIVILTSICGVTLYIVAFGRQRILRIVAALLGMVAAYAVANTGSLIVFLVHHFGWMVNLFQPDTIKQLPSGLTGWIYPALKIFATRIM
jgi:hypothetical protein